MTKKKVAKKTTKKVAKKAVKKATKKVAKKATKKVAKKIAKKATKKVAKKIAKKTTKKAAKKIAKKTTKKAVKKIAKKTTKKVAKKATKKATKKIPVKTAKKVTKKATKNIGKKTTKKITKKTTKKATEKATAKVPAKAAKKVTKKAVKKVAKKTTKKTAKKTATRMTKKAVRKTAKKVATKTTTKAPQKTVSSKKGPKKISEKVLSEREKKTSHTLKESDDKASIGKKKPSSGKDQKMSKAALLDDVRDFDFEAEIQKDLTRKEKKDITSDTREKLSEGISELSGEYSLREIFQAIKTLEFYTSDSDECMFRNCENPATTMGYCRFHYISDWKEIKKRQKILEEGQLQQMIEEMISKYPLKFVESVISDLTDEKSFFAILKEMDIDADEDSYEDLEGGDDDQDIAFETKSSSKEGMFEE